MSPKGLRSIVQSHRYHWNLSSSFLDSWQERAKGTRERLGIGWRSGAKWSRVMNESEEVRSSWRSTVGPWLANHETVTSPKLITRPPHYRPPKEETTGGDPSGLQGVAKGRDQPLEGIMIQAYLGPLTGLQ